MCSTLFSSVICRFAHNEFVRHAKTQSTRSSSHIRSNALSNAEGLSVPSSALHAALTHELAKAHDTKLSGL